MALYKIVSIQHVNSIVHGFSSTLILIFCHCTLLLYLAFFYSGIFPPNLKGTFHVFQCSSTLCLMLTWDYTQHHTIILHCVWAVTATTTTSLLTTLKYLAICLSSHKHQCYVHNSWQKQQLSQCKHSNCCFHILNSKNKKN